MVKCTKCGTVLDCGCKGPESKESALEKKPGAIWVHVTDDAGVDLAGIGVERGFPAPTNGKGLAIQDPLKPHTYPVTLAVLSSDNTDKYDLPSDPDYEVRVENGAISHVDYTLFRKATLAAEFVLRSDDQTRFEGSTITVKVERLAEWSAFATPGPLAKTTVTSDKGLAGFGPVSAGKYKLTPDYSALDKREQFDLEETPQTVDLSPAEPKSVKFHVQQKAALKVEIVFKRPQGSKLPKRYLDDFAVPVNIEFETGKKDSKNTDKGIADFAWVLPGKYKIKPDYSVLDVCKYDWPQDDSQDVELKPGDNDPIVFEVEPLYQQVQFVAHCILAIPDQVYQEAPGEATFLDIQTPPDAPKTFAYKSRPVVTGAWSKPELQNLIGSRVTKWDFKMNAAIAKKSWFIIPRDPDTIVTIRADCVDQCDIADDGAVTFKHKTASEPYTWKDIKGDWKGRYHGKPNDKEDVDARVSFVNHVLDKAHQKTKDDPKILKVLLFPECFFQGLYGAYPLEETNYLVSELRKAVADEKWRDWVFAFGTVNTVFGAYLPDPSEGGTVSAKSSVQEMTNHAPVMRGGIPVVSAKLDKDYDTTDMYNAVRMIQKLVNSAELADEVVVDPNVKLERPQAINATHQFSDTANDQVWIKVLTEIMRKELKDGSPGKLFTATDKLGMPAEWWKAPACTHGLWDELSVVVSEWGMARTIRAIRVSVVPPTIEWSKWTFASREGAKLDLIKDNPTVFPDLKTAAVVVLKKEWDRQEASTTNVPFSGANWSSNDIRRAAVLLELKTKAAQVASECGFKLSYQQTAIANEIAPLTSDDSAAKNYLAGTEAKSLTLAGLKELWNKTVSPPPFNGANWSSDDDRRNAVLNELYADAIKERKVLQQVLDPTPLQKTLKKELEPLVKDDSAAKAYVPDQVIEGVSFAPTIFPIWKVLLQYYAASQGKSTAMAMDKTSMRLEDYCFAAPRKAGPFYAELGDAKNIPSCKRLVFGLEICADHAAQRIKSITGSATAGVDIQMVVSAGMKPGYMATRLNGLLMNCDGWSTKVDEDKLGGKNMEVVLDGPSPTNYFDPVSGQEKFVTPVYPHSAMCQRTSDTDDDAVKAKWFKPASPVIPDADKAKIIFGKGPGELHIYDPQDLPR